MEELRKSLYDSAKEGPEAEEATGKACFSKKQFLSSVHSVQETVLRLSQNSAVEHTSIDDLFSDSFRERRLQYSPQEKYRRPLTTSQTLGWFTPSEHEFVRRFPKLACEETTFASNMVRAGVFF
jgi:hypothetical protein